MVYLAGIRGVSTPTRAAPRERCTVRIADLPGVTRFAIGLYAFTCTIEQADTIRAWIEKHGEECAELDLPFPESPEPPDESRWTTAAGEIAHEACERIKAERAARRARTRAARLRRRAAALLAEADKLDVIAASEQVARQAGG